MNNHRFITVEENGRLRLSYNMDEQQWKMSGGKYGDHKIYAKYDGRYQGFDSRNKRVAAHWAGYQHNNL